MVTYKNDFKKEEDIVLWELHEIRQKIYKDYGLKDFEKINEKGKALFNEAKSLKLPKQKVKRKKS